MLQILCLSKALRKYCKTTGRCDLIILETSALSPSTSRHEGLPRDVVEAELVGRSGNCSKYQPQCPLELFDLIGVLAWSLKNRRKFTVPLSQSKQPNCTAVGSLDENLAERLHIGWKLGWTLKTSSSNKIENLMKKMFLDARVFRRAHACIVNNM